MLTKILGRAKLGAKQTKLRGGPQSLKPMRPTKGSGVANGTGLATRLGRQYVTPRQNPVFSPNKSGLQMRGMQTLSGRAAVRSGSALPRKKVK